VTIGSNRINSLAGPELKEFPGSAKKILPVILLLAGVTGCHNTSVSANTGSPKAPVVAPAGSVLRVRLDQALDTKRSRPGDRFTGVLDSPVVADGKEILAKGTIVQGHVLSARPSGRIKGRAELSLTLDSCQVNGLNLPLSTDMVVRVSGNHRKRNWTIVGGGAGTGALVGGAVAGPAGALIGAGSGAAAGTAGAAVSGQKDVSMPAESVVGFTLKAPLAV
jgi:hypothetical protein